jgi:hypothetical protein
VRRLTAACLVAFGAATLPAADVTRAPGPPWSRHVIDASSRGADGIKVGDLNGDGRPDLVTGWEEGGVVRAYLHPGHGQVRAPWPAVTVGEVTDAEDAVFADLDGDGRLEVISATEGRTRTVYWHQPPPAGADLLDPRGWRTTAFPALSGRHPWMQLLPLQLDGEHGPDLIVAAKGAGSPLGWLRAPADPAAVGDWSFHPLRPAAWVMTLHAHDFDGDGDQDLLFSDRKGDRAGLFWLENPGAAANRIHQPWREYALGARGREVMFADLADLDGDGRPEVLAAVKPRDIVVLHPTPDGRWREETLSLPAEGLGDAKAVRAADLNGDGRVDLVLSCEHARGELEGVVWLERRADGGWWQWSLAGAPGVKFDLLQLLDLDGDGDLDVLTCEEADGLGVVWYENPTRRRP